MNFPQLYVIYSGTTYEYVAHEAIILKPGFHAEAGSNFTARIEVRKQHDATSIKGST